MILPVFDYCAVVWDSCGKTVREYLDKLQKRAAGIIEGYTGYCRYLAHSVAFQSRRDYLNCMLVFKSLHGLAQHIYL